MDRVGLVGGGRNERGAAMERLAVGGGGGLWAAVGSPPVTSLVSWSSSSISSLDELEDDAAGVPTK